MNEKISLSESDWTNFMGSLLVCLPRYNWKRFSKYFQNSRRKQEQSPKLYRPAGNLQTSSRSQERKTWRHSEPRRSRRRRQNVKSGRPIGLSLQRRRNGGRRPVKLLLLEVGLCRKIQRNEERTYWRGQMTCDAILLVENAFSHSDRFYSVKSLYIC